MTAETFIQQLSARGNVLYSVCRSPVGEIYLLGNDAALMSIIFKNKRVSRLGIEKLFKKGSNSEINSAASFLESYFSNTDAAHSIRPKIKVLPGLQRSLFLIGFNGHALHLDLSGFTDKEIAVYRTLLNIGPGKTISYNRLSEKAGIPSGARFVGNAMAKNNFPIIIPCHRVIKSDGSVGNYSGGIEIKNFLLNHENL